MAEQDFHIDRIISSLSQELSQLDDLVDITPEEISSLKGDFYEDVISQNPDGTWSKQRIIIERDTSTAEERIQKEYEDRQKLSVNYIEVAIPIDKKIFEYNKSINDKKTEIATIFVSAVNFGCSLKNFVQNSNTLLINCVACGIGSTVYADDVYVNRHPNIEQLNFIESDTFRVTSDLLDQSRYGVGFEDVARINLGSTISGDFTTTIGNFISIIDTRTFCVGCANSIKQLATDIENLRKERDSSISAVNVVKKNKDQSEFITWSLANFRSDVLAKNIIKTQLSNITNIVEDVVLDKLFVYIDASRPYSIKSRTNSLTGVNIITQIDNLGSDGSLVSLGDFYPSYDSLDGPSIWFNQYGITGKYFNFPKSYVLNVGEAIDECGQTELFGDTSYSMEAWIKINDTSYLSSNIITGGASIVGVASTAGIGLQVYEPETNKAVVNFGSRGSGSLDTKTEIQVDTWYHVVGVREKDKGSKLYLNGVVDASTDTVGIGTSSLYITSPQSGSVMRVGFCSSTYINQFFPGKISVIRLYSKALSETEVLKNFNASKTRYGYS
jgi:hypothetical protein